MSKITLSIFHIICMEIGRKVNKCGSKISCKQCNNNNNVHTH